MSREALHPPVGPNDHCFGPADAAVVLVEYGDYECPNCGRAFVILRGVLADLGDRVRFVYRNFPLSDIHPRARAAAEAAESTGAHGGNEAFWHMHAMLYMNQDALEIDDLLGYAEAAGVDVEAVADDLTTHAQRRRVQADFESGIHSGVSGTPTFFINGIPYSGTWSDPDLLAAALRDAAAAGWRA